MKINKQLIGSIIFNISETVLIFCTTRGCLGKALHFKTWYRCLVWSCLILLSLFMILKIDLKISILFTIFSAFIMTGKSNINDMYLWKPKNESKYVDIEEYIKYNITNSKLIEFEENLKKRDNLLYLVYKYRFKDNLSFSQISEKLNGIENVRIVEKLDQIALAIRIHCGI